MAYLLKILEGMCWYKYLEMVHIFIPFPTLYVYLIFTTKTKHHNSATMQHVSKSFELPHGKTNNLHRRKQRSRSALR